MSIVVEKPLKICQEYWNRQLLNRVNNKTEVSCHHLLHEVNLNSLFSDSFYASHNPIIQKADKEFRELKPTEQNMTIWRGIRVPDKNSFFYNKYIQYLFDKANSLKLNDRFVMREYAYAGYTQDDAEMYASHNGIVFKINVPRGAKISRNKIDITLPRYSELICRDIEKYKYYKMYTLDYILPNFTQP